MDVFSRYKKTVPACRNSENCFQIPILSEEIVMSVSTFANDYENIAISAGTSHAPDFFPVNLSDRILFSFTSLWTGNKNFSLDFSTGEIFPYIIYIKVETYDFYTSIQWVKQNTVIHPQKTNTVFRGCSMLP